VTKKAEQTNSDIAVVLCDCGGTLCSRLDFDQLQKHLSKLSEAPAVKLCSKFCQQNECSRAIKSLFGKKKQTKRLVIGACDQEIFDKTLREAADSVNLNEGLLWCVNIREHCGWIAGTSDAATDKAKQDLTAAVRRIKLADPLKQKTVRVNQNVLVLGGSLAAMQTAAALSKLGHKVVLVTQDESLGEPAAETPELYAYVDSDSSSAEALVRAHTNELIDQVRNDKKITVRTFSKLKSLAGEFGKFTAVLSSNSAEEKIYAGVVILAEDSAPVKSDLAELLHNDTDLPKRIAIVMDILGEQGKAVSAQVLSAAEMLAKRFGAEVKLYCHNIRTAAMGMEALYRRAREAGGIIVKYELPPAILEKDSKKVVSVQEPAVGYEIEEQFDLVVTANKAAANSYGELVKLIEGLRPGPEGLLQADNVWLLPTKTNCEGVFVVGSASGTDELREAQADGLATASQIHELLKSKQMEIFDDAAVVDSDKCVLCLTCIRICPHAAVSIDIDNKAAFVSAVACQRCGICTAECPAGAIELPRYTQKQITAEVGDKPKITVFACENSAYPAATAAGTNGSQWQQAVQLIRIPCAGKVDTRDVLRALECGAQKVIILGCHIESCQYLAGSTRAAKRAERLNNALEKARIDKNRVVFGQLASVEPYKFLEYISKNGA